MIFRFIKRAYTRFEPKPSGIPKSMGIGGGRNEEV